MDRQSCMPNFFIVGAPKCGTTWLANVLAASSQVFIPQGKELFYFNSDKLGGVQNFSEYKKYFDNVPVVCRAIGDATTHYLNSVDAIENIKDYDPSSKIIICVRHPVDMAISLHAQRVKEGLENIFDFEKAWNAQSDRIVGKRLPSRVRRAPHLLQYRDFCETGRQVEKVKKIIKNDNIKIIFFDDIVENPYQVIREVSIFLDVEEVPTPIEQHSNAAKQPKNYALNKFLRHLIFLKREYITRRRFGVGTFITERNSVKANPHVIVSPKFKNQILQCFQEDISKLEFTTSTNLSLWREKY